MPRPSMALLSTLSTTAHRTTYTTTIFASERWNSTHRVTCSWRSEYGIKAGGSYQRIFYYQKLVDQATFSDSTNDYHYPKTTDSLWE